ncbi:spartin, partial [Tremellales sp. Uapishka_1]
MATASPRSLSGASTPASSQSSDGYLLLSIQHASVQQTMVLAKGEFQLQCVSMAIPPTIGHQTANPFSPSPSDPKVPTHDFWLVIHVGPTYELALNPDQQIDISPSKDAIRYEILSNVPNGSLILSLPLPSSNADMEDLESLEILLHQYGSLSASKSGLVNVSAPVLGANPVGDELLGPEFRGKLVLVNQDNGQVIGELEQSLSAEEDQKLAREGRNQPVMLDFGQITETGLARSVVVKTVPQDEMDDWLLKGANDISNWSTNIMQNSARNFIQTATPRSEPVKFSNTTKAGFRTIHNASAATMKVTKKTTGAINDTIAKVVETGYLKGVQPAVDTYRRASAPDARTLPPLPPRRSPEDPLTRRSPPPVPPKPASLSTGPPQPYDQPDEYAAQVDSPVGQTKKRGFLSRAWLATEVVLTSVEATVSDLITVGTETASAAAGHKYGAEAGTATALVGGSVRNVAVVYIDVRGVGRRGIMKATAKGFVKTRLTSGETVVLQGEGKEGEMVHVGDVSKTEEGEMVVEVAEVKGYTTGTELRDEWTQQYHQREIFGDSTPFRTIFESYAACFSNQDVSNFYFELINDSGGTALTGGETPQSLELEPNEEYTVLAYYAVESGDEDD